MFDENISIIIPFKTDFAERETNFKWLLKRVKVLLPNAEICVGDSDIAPYCKAAAVNKAVANSNKEILMILDADIAFDREDIEKSIDMLSIYPWVIPFVNTFLLSENQTQQLINKSPDYRIKDFKMEKCNTYPLSVGQLNILPRECFKKVNGFDERFKGWGWEDVAFQKSLDAVCGNHGRPENISVWHLYHPPASMHKYDDNYDIFKRDYQEKDKILATVEARINKQY